MRQIISSKRVGVLAAVTAVAVASCGGDDGASPASDELPRSVGEETTGEEASESGEAAGSFEDALAGAGELTDDLPADSNGLMPSPCDLITVDEINELTGKSYDTAMDNSGGLTGECLVDGGFFAIRIGAMTPSAWAEARNAADTSPISDSVGDDAYVERLQSGDVFIHVLSGPIHVRVYDGFVEDEETFASAGTSIAAELLARADLTAVTDLAASMPDIAPCDLLTEDEFTDATGRQPDQRSGPRPDGLLCSFRAGMESGGGSVDVEIEPTSADDYQMLVSEADSYGEVLDDPGVGDDSIAMTIFGEYLVDARVGAVRLTVIPYGFDDDTALDVATDVARAVAAKL